MHREDPGQNKHNFREWVVIISTTNLMSYRNIYHCCVFILYGYTCISFLPQDLTSRPVNICPILSIETVPMYNWY